MAKNNALKIGAGTAAILLGIYILFNQTNLPDVIFGVIAVGFGFWLLASN